MSAAEAAWSAADPTVAGLTDDARVERRVRDRAEERADRLQQLTEHLAAALTPEQVAEGALLPALSVLEAAGAALLLREPGPPPVLTVAGYAGYAPEDIERWRRTPLDPDIPAGAAVLTGDPVYLASAEEGRHRFPAVFDAPVPPALKAWAALPLRSGPEVIGALAVGFAASREFTPAERRYLETVAAQCALAVERTRLYGTVATERERLAAVLARLDAAYAAEQLARAAAEAAGERLGRLQQTTAGLAEALTVQEVAAVVVSGAMSIHGCRSAWVGVLDEPGDALVALAASYPLQDGVAARIPLGAASPRAEATRTGQPVWLPSTAEALSRYPGLRALGVRDGALGVVPLVSHGRPVGAMMLDFGDERPFEAAERALITTLAEQCAQALERARLHERSRDVALTLQQSMLPSGLPDVPGLELAARYHPAVDSLTVGGDWYDVVALPAGKVALAVGDVVGRGLDAATTMGKLRSALAALALTGDPPARVLDGLERYARQVRGARLATVAYCVLDPVGGTLRYACAGHPPPLVVHPDGRSELLEDGRSPLLCAVPPGVVGGARPEGTHRLEPGDRLLLYSDGLVERRRESLDTGLRRLAAAVVDVGTGPGWSAALVTRMLAGADDDDVALLSVAYAPELTVRVPARGAELAGVRRRLRTWLAAVGATGDETADVLLATGEATANAVEHAFPDGPGEVVVELRLAAGRELTVRVADSGRWLQDAAPGDRGRGLPLMRAVTDAVRVDSGTEGTVVRMRLRLGERA